MSPEKLKPQRQWWDQKLGFKDTFSYQKCCWSDLLFIKLSYFEGSLGHKYVKIIWDTNFGVFLPNKCTCRVARTNEFSPLKFSSKREMYAAIFVRLCNWKVTKISKKKVYSKCCTFLMQSMVFFLVKTISDHSWQRPRLFKRWMALSTG